MSNISTVIQDIGFTHQNFIFIFKKHFYQRCVWELPHICRAFQLQDDTMSLIHLYLSSVWWPICQDTALLGALSLRHNLPHCHIRLGFTWLSWWHLKKKRSSNTIHSYFVPHRWIFDFLTHRMSKATSLEEWTQDLKKHRWGRRRRKGEGEGRGGGGREGEDRLIRNL